MVSVIFPSRGRFNHLVKTLDSIIDNCSDVTKIEILVKLDDDDFETLEKINSYKNIDLINVRISNRKKGYESLNEFYNELYEVSTGEFIFCINDDVIIETQNWDKLIEVYSGQLVCLHHNPTYPHNDGWYFPIVSKKILDVIGCVSKSVFYDSYILKLLENLDVFRNINLSINHSLIHDSTTSEKCESIKKNRESTEWEFFYEKKPLLMIDREKVINYLNEKR